MEQMNLAEVPVGDRARVCGLNSSPETCRRLRELGFCESAVVRCVSRGGTSLICELQNTRIGLSVSLAKDIVVDRVE